MTNSASWFIKFPIIADDLFCLIGNQQIKAGKIVNVKNNVATIPTATRFPSCLNGGEIEKFKDKKPMPVVIHATEIAAPCSEIAFLAQIVLSLVLSIVCLADESICTALATAKVTTIRGAIAVTVFIGTPDQPKLPIVTPTVNIIISSTAAVPKKVLNKIATAISEATITKGTRVLASS